MLTITIQVNAPSGQAIGIKEDIATYLEKFGPAERTRQAVYATGNKWAIENFEATHS